MIQTVTRRCWPGLLAVAFLAGGFAVSARADGPLPIATNSVFYYRFDVKVGPHAFARPTGPWYSYFPVDPNLLAQPRAATFPNWPSQFPPAPAVGMGFYPATQYGYGAAVSPVGAYAAPPPAYWYGQ